MSIVIENLCKKFGATPVLQNFSWTVDRPMVLMGRSGCGKTTLLRILLGLETADSGTVTGVETPAAVFQEDRLCPQLTAAVNLTLTGHGLSPQEAERSCAAWALPMPSWPCPLHGSPVGRSAAPPYCGHFSARMLPRCCWMNPSPAWTPSLSPMLSPPQSGWQGRGPRFWSPMTAPPPTCWAGR